MKQLIVLALFAIACAAVSQTEFQVWMTENNKMYATNEEYDFRFGVFKNAVAKIAELNKNTDNVTYGLNSLADLTTDEFSYLLGLKGHKFGQRQFAPLPNAPLDGAPSSYNWCNEGHCTPIKDQGQCGSCWAFATTENIESVSSIKGHGLPELSPQQIVDCDTSEAGCGGGDPAQAYLYVRQQGGLDTASYYPYHAVRGSCRYSSSAVGARVTGEANGYGGSENQMAANLAATAPFSILVDASSWQYYKSGVLSAGSCGHSIDHAVVAVGYSLPDYWIVRNSWGTGWGERGYIRLQFGQNTCALRTEVLTATM